MFVTSADLVLRLCCRRPYKVL